MTYSSCLTDPDASLILDASVLINLHASSKGVRILSAIPNKIYVARNVADEMQVGDGSVPSERDFVFKLEERGLLEIIDMKDGDLAIYENYVSGERSLDDGEAATIAMALKRGCLPVIDERKACSRLAKDAPGLSVPTTVDLMLSQPVKQSLSPMDRRHAVYKALTDARMHVRPDQRDSIIELIGTERAVQCNSLPGFKNLRKQLEFHRANST